MKPKPKWKSSKSDDALDSLLITKLLGFLMEADTKVTPNIPSLIVEAEAPNLNLTHNANSANSNQDRAYLCEAHSEVNLKIEASGSETDRQHSQSAGVVSSPDLRALMRHNNRTSAYGNNSISSINNLSHNNLNLEYMRPTPRSSSSSRNRPRSAMITKDNVMFDALKKEFEKYSVKMHHRNANSLGVISSNNQWHDCLSYFRKGVVYLAATDFVKKIVLCKDLLITDIAEDFNTNFSYSFVFEVRLSEKLIGSDDIDSYAFLCNNYFKLYKLWQDFYDAIFYNSECTIKTEKCPDPDSSTLKVGDASNQHQQLLSVDNINVSNGDVKKLKANKSEIELMYTIFYIVNKTSIKMPNSYIEVKISENCVIPENTDETFNLVVANRRKGSEADKVNNDLMLSKKERLPGVFKYKFKPPQTKTTNLCLFKHPAEIDIDTFDHLGINILACTIDDFKFEFYIFFDDFRPKLPFMTDEVTVKIFFPIKMRNLFLAKGKEEAFLKGVKGKTVHSALDAVSLNINHGTAMYNRRNGAIEWNMNYKTDPTLRNVINAKKSSSFKRAAIIASKISDSKKSSKSPTVKRMENRRRSAADFKLECKVECPFEVGMDPNIVFHLEIFSSDADNEFLLEKNYPVPENYSNVVYNFKYLFYEKLNMK